VRSGRVDEAAKLLEDLGNLDPFNSELMSLRDKANLALGYALLQDGQPLAAKPPLQRVRLEGPFSNKALLGVGWADAEMNNYQRALVPWMELRSRDLLDSAVQESMLAIPFAMAQLDSISQAADHYLNAIEAFYEETNRLDRTIGHIESGSCSTISWPTIHWIAPAGSGASRSCRKGPRDATYSTCWRLTSSRKASRITAT